MIRVIIAGGRQFHNYKLLKAYCDKVLARLKKEGNTFQIVSGTAGGADLLGEKYAKERGYKIRYFPADWDQYGKSAGYIRNTEMAKNADYLIAFWDGQSKGTGHMIEIAKSAKLPTRICKYA